MFLLAQSLGAQIKSVSLTLLIISAVIHIIFAGAVARDAAHLTKRGIHTHLVSSMTWAFATLIGGVWTAAIYWFIHHVNWNRR